MGVDERDLIVPYELYSNKFFLHSKLGRSGVDSTAYDFGENTGFKSLDYYCLVFMYIGYTLVKFS